MVMFIPPPGVRSWWTATHQFHTSVCTGPATYPSIRPSFSEKLNDYGIQLEPSLFSTAQPQPQPQGNGGARR